MKTKLHGILVLFLVLCVQLSFAQEKTITGIVSDESGPLPGVSVLIQGTNTGTVTDFDGKYTIKAKQGANLVFSFVGMDNQTKTVGAANVINVLMSGSQLLQEVVVVAYGQQSKKSIVGSIAVVESGVIEKQLATSVTTSLQGAVSGVNIINSGGQPGDNPTIRVRGTGSINAAADPLIIVDGAAFTGNLNTISSDQIESMSVLKDASSTALYGSRGSNGVILITTKKGKYSSPTKFSLRTSLGVSDQAVKHHDLIDADTFITYSWEAYRNSNQYVSGQTPSVAATNATNNLISNLGYNPYGIANPVDVNGNLVTTTKLWETDWQKALFNEAALRTEHSISASGGSENTTYYFSGNYMSQEGSIKTSKFQRVSLRTNIDSKIKSWLNAGLSTSYSTSNQNYPTQAGTAFQSATQWLFTIPSYYPLYRRNQQGELILDAYGKPLFDYGNATGQSINATRPALGGENAVGALYNYDVLRGRDNFLANTYIKINFNDNLTFKTNLSYEKYLFDAFDYVHNEFGYAASVKGRVSQNRDITETINLVNQLNYTRSIDNHNFNIDGIFESFKSKYLGLGAQGVGFLPNVKVLNGSTTPEGVSGFLSEERMLSYLGRVAYNYNNKYFIEGSYRTDGSTKFRDDVRWGDFFSVGGSWVVSDEDFMSNVDFINFLKLKASFGETGNNRGIGYFPYLQLFVTGWNQLDNTGVISGSVTDPTLTWEKTRSTNFGVSLRMFNDRLSADVDYYDKESVDLIYDKPLALSTGNESIKTNVGAIRNYGIEVSLNSVNVKKKDFDWTTNINMSFDKNEVTELTQESFISGTKRWEVGKSLYEFYIREYAGVDPADGFAMFYKDVLDANGQKTGERTTTKTYSQASLNYVNKSSLPDVIGGFSNYFRYKNFDANLLFNFSLGSYVMDYTYANLMQGFKNAGRAASPDLARRWQKPGDITDVPLFLASNNDFNSTSDRFLFKNDYLRLKALNVGYSLPKETLAPYGISNIRFYFQGDNLLTFQSHKGIDPEQDLAGTTNNRSFNQRTMSFGINLDF